MSASEASREDRHLPASERRIQQARDEGQLPRSRELVHFAAALALIGLVAGLGPWLARQALELMAAGLRFDRAAAFETRQMMPRLSFFGLQGLQLAVPVALSLVLLLGAASMAVGGWNLSTQALAPKFERLNPVAALGRIFDTRALIGHVRMVAVTGALLGAAAWYVEHHAAELDALATRALAAGITEGFGWLVGGLTLVATACFFSALADVPLQIWQHLSRLRMTHQEARDEHKQDEGDPHVKGERRRRARELTRGRMLADVPRASVVVTNPSHYAVALEYDDATMAAPRIVAMGTDLLAFKIREVAAASRVPVLEAPPLARALYSHGEVGGEVPVALYTAVAQVLAWVMRVQNALRPPPAPVIEVPPGLDPHEAKA